MVTRNSMPVTPWWVIALITAILTVITTIYTTDRSFKITDQNALLASITVLQSANATLEAKVASDHDRLTYIQTRVDQILDKLLSWERSSDDSHKSNSSK